MGFYTPDIAASTLGRHHRPRMSPPPPATIAAALSDIDCGDIACGDIACGDFGGTEIDATLPLTAPPVPVPPLRRAPTIALRPSPRSDAGGSAALIGESRAIADIRADIDVIAGSASSVLITGPSGSGKDVVAQLLHRNCRRASAAFVALNCAAVARDLLESEMFGHEAGAFTGAVRARAGRFEAAHGGTLFLDEVGDMPLAMQAKLLRALETRVVERVGGMLPIAVDVRLIAATSVDLIAAIDRGSFRADLLYRLDVIRIEMPPLADRIEDVPLLIDHFLARQPRLPVRFSAGAMAGLMRHDWPGNVRELKNVVERAQALFAGQSIDAAALPKLLRPAATAPSPPMPARAAAPSGAISSGGDTRIEIGRGVDLKRILADLETAYITEALATSGGAIASTAKLLGLQRTTLIEKMRRLGIHSA